MRPLLAYGGPITPIATPEFIFCQVVVFGFSKLDTYLLWQSSYLLLLDEFSQAVFNNTRPPTGIGAGAGGAGAGFGIEACQLQHFTIRGAG